MSVSAAQVAFRPFSRYIFIGARARTRSQPHYCCQQSTPLLANKQIRWRSAPAFRVEENEEENESVEAAAWELKAPFVGKLPVLAMAQLDVESYRCLDAPPETSNSDATESLVNPTEEAALLPNSVAAAPDVRVRPTIAQYYSVDGVSVEDLRPVNRP
jgi:hypothetical protein